MFNSALWTRRGNSPKIESLDLVTRERPEVASERAALAPSPRRQQGLLEEYAQLSKLIGFENPHIDADLKIEKFKAFLRAKDWPVFSLPTVKAYMDKKSAEESASRAGWHWRPLRLKDNIKDARFGTAAHRWGHQENEASPASDYYVGPQLRAEPIRSISLMHNQMEQVQPSGAPYNKLVPIHALRKVAEIERDFADPVAFFVCDYAPAPHIEHPDPFLMAVMDNERLSAGVGRFVIDFWDEPGFGLEAQLT